MYFLLCGLLAGYSQVVRASPIAACGGENEWPPSSYYERNERGETGVDVAGISPEVLRAALPTARVDVMLLPFMRCLASAEEGDRVQIVMGGTRTLERERVFWFSRPYLKLQPALFAWPGAHAALPLCGLKGFNYQPFGVTAQQLDDGSSSYAQLVRKLQAGRCRGFVEYYEVGRGLMRLGLLGEGGSRLKVRLLEDRPAVALHFMVSRRYAGGAAVLQQLDRGIQLLQESGRLKAMLEPHLAPVGD